MYEWLRDGAPISGATGSSYLLTQDDVGRSVSVKVTYSDMLGTGESVSSGALGPVANVNDPHPHPQGKNGVESSIPSRSTSLCRLPTGSGS
jgi:hypothetical protein